MWKLKTRRFLQKFKGIFLKITHEINIKDIVSPMKFQTRTKLQNKKALSASSEYWKQLLRISKTRIYKNFK